MIHKQKFVRDTHTMTKLIVAREFLKYMRQERSSKQDQMSKKVKF